MGFTDLFIRRPVLACVVSLIILLVGARAYFALPLRLFPRIDPTVVTVNVTYPGANASVMEGFVTTPLENAIGAVDGIDYIKSESTNSSSHIVIHFTLGYNINTAISDVSDKVSSVRYKLPREINDPVISKQDPNAQPIQIIAFTSKQMSGSEVSDYLLRVVQPQLGALTGVGEAMIWGSQEYAMRIWLNTHKMAAHDVTIGDVNKALTTNNLQSPTGFIKGKLQEFDVNANTDVGTAHQFNNLVIREKNSTLTRISDVGRAELGITTDRFSVSMDGEQAVFVAIIPKSTANPLEVSQAVQKTLDKIQKRMPQDMRAQVLYNAANFIDSSISEVQRTIIEAAFFVILVIFLFLGSFRTLLIPSITIPLSLIGVCGVMLAMGYSLNTLTFLAMVLAIGMVVDDAIVVSENIHRHVEAGHSALESALMGAREIKFAVIAMTLTLAAVYAPIAFMTGLTGALFKEFAFTLAATIIISGIIALTLSPMMCSKVMTPSVMTGRLAGFSNGITNAMMRGYKRVLPRLLQGRWIVLAGLIGALAACYLLFISIPAELAPAEDEGFLQAFISAPSSANIDFTTKYTNALIPIFQSIPELAHFGIINGIPKGVNTAISFVSLKPWDQRKRSVEQIIQSILPKMMAIPGILAFPINPSALPGSGFGPKLQLVLKTTKSYEALNRDMQKLLAAVRQNPRLVNVNTDLKLDKPQVDVDINRDMAGDLGISMAQIGLALNVGLGEPTVSYFTKQGRSYDVIPQLALPFRNHPEALNDLNLRTVTGGLVPFSNLVTLKESVQPQSLNHFQQQREATLSASTTPGYTIGQALDYLNTLANQILPKDMQFDYAGGARQYVEASGKMMLTFVFALLFIYLILAAQFESFRDPFIVMLTVPLSTLGALLFLKLTPGGTMNIYTEIGLVTLIGLISKHGILMIDFANQLQERGKSLRDAIIEAASIRLRPILMTTIAMILGATPLAMASGAGANSRHQIGIVIIGGMLIGTLFTLFVIPVMYSFLAVKKVVAEQPA